MSSLGCRLMGGGCLWEPKEHIGTKFHLVWYDKKKYTEYTVYYPGMQ